MAQSKSNSATKTKSSDSGAGSVIPGYSILARIGKGGMGTVFKAIQLSMNRLVALKMLPLSLAKDKTYIRRFLREAKSAASMNHPNLTRVYDVGSYRGVFYFSMEYVEGDTLLGLIKSEGKLDPETATDIILQAARGLRHAHSHSIVHRDIKPENIMIATDGTVKVTDMGLAKRTDTADHDITLTGQVIGTPCYMSPEQITDPKSVDTRSDIYSLGATFFHMLSGKRPFTGENSAQTMLKVVGEEPDWRNIIDVPIPVLRTVKHMLAKNPARRYKTVGDLINELLYLKERLFSPHKSRRLAFISTITSPSHIIAKGAQAAISEAPSRKVTFILAVLTLSAVLIAILFNPNKASEPSTALPGARQALVQKPEPGLSFEEYFEKGIRLGKLGRWDEALAYFDNATTRDPFSYDAWNNRGTCLYHLNDFEKAAQSFIKALERNPEAPDIHFNLGRALLELDRLEKALEEFEAAIDLDSAYYPAWWGKAIALKRLERHEEAYKAELKATELKK